MSYYHKYDFISPEPLFALVKEELKSYFDTNAVDDSLFPKYVEKCLRKLGKSSYPVNQTVLNIADYEARVPDDFYAVREAWMCTAFGTEFTLPSATYTQVKQESTRIDDPDIYCNVCNQCEFPDVIQAVYKTTNTVAFQWRKQYLLTPGNLYPSCPTDLYCANYNAVAPNSYDVRSNKFNVTFPEGTVYMQYYSDAVDENHNQLVPDEYRILEFIEAFLKEKVFEQLSNQATDETFNQIQGKYQLYKQMADEAYINANTENTKEDVYRKQRSVRRLRNRLKKYNIR